MSRFLFKRSFLLLAGAGILLVLILALLVITGKSDQIVFEPLPNPNGYDEFLAASRMLNTLTNQIPVSEAMDVEELRKFVSKAKPALDRARSALKLPSRVPIDYSKQGATKADLDHVDELNALRRVGMVYSAEARLAEKNDHLDEEAASLADLIQFGVKVGRGGATIDEFISLGIIKMGTQPMEILIGKLNASQSRSTLKRLVEIKSLQEPLEKMLQRHAYHTKSESGDPNPFRRIAFNLSRRKDNILLEKKAILNRHKFDQQFQSLQIHLASHAYELEKGKPPASNKDLVPEYLGSVPTER